MRNQKRIRSHLSLSPDPQVKKVRKTKNATAVDATVEKDEQDVVDAVTSSETTEAEPKGPAVELEGGITGEISVPSAGIHVPNSEEHGPLEAIEKAVSEIGVEKTVSKEVSLPGTVFDDVVGLNPYYTGRLAEAKILGGVLAITVGRDRFVNVLRNIEILDVLRSHRPTIAKRILQVSNHADVVQLKSPPGGIVNMAVADPSKFKLINGYVSSVDHNIFVVASLTAVTTYFNNSSSGIRQICVKPFFHSWPRFTAVIGKILGADVLHFRTWENGVLFGMGMYHSRGPRVNRSMGGACAPIQGAILPTHEDIPVYDGREKLSLAKYWAKPYNGAVRPGSTVSILFSIKHGSLPEDARWFKLSKSMAGVYLNVLGVIVLAEPSDTFCLDTCPDPASVHGVDILRRMEEDHYGVDEGDSVVEEDDEVPVGEVF